MFTKCLNMFLNMSFLLQQIWIGPLIYFAAIEPGSLSTIFEDLWSNRLRKAAAEEDEEEQQQQ